LYAEVWSEERLFFTGDEYFTELLLQIKHAKVSIDIEVYIFAVDTLTKLLMSELAAAKKRGLRVRVLVDGAGSFVWVPRLTQWSRETGVALRVYKPFPRTLSMAGRFYKFYFLRLTRLLQRLNHRDHRKLVLIDHQTAFVGSMNFTQEHSRQIVGDDAWRDTSLMVKGAPILDLRKSFDSNWEFSNPFRALFPFLRKRVHREYRPRLSPVRLNTTRRWRASLYRDLLIRLDQAKKEILITNAYFLPRRSLFRHLKKAAARGVKVIIMIAGPSDVPIVRLSASELIHRLVLAQVEVYEYNHSILHAKTMIIDDFAIVGSMNLNHRSFVHDLELDVVLTKPDSVVHLKDQFQADLKSCRRITDSEYTNMNWIKKLFAKIAYQFRYWL
jgi:cardiolipin synthase